MASLNLDDRQDRHPSPSPSQWVVRAVLAHPGVRPLDLARNLGISVTQVKAVRAQHPKGVA